jgi:predicted GIY-YIG superfamily endonuclease
MIFITRELKEAYEKVEGLYYKLIDEKSNFIIQKECYIGITREILQYPDLLSFWDLKDAVDPKKRIVLVRTLPKDMLIAESQSDVELYSLFYQPAETPLSNAYIVYLKDKKMLKVGKTNNIKQRMTALKKQYGEIQMVHTFGFNNEEDAYLMEIILHKYFKQKYPNNFIPQDRFADAEVTQEDIEILEKSAQKIQKTLWF